MIAILGAGVLGYKVARSLARVRAVRGSTRTRARLDVLRRGGVEGALLSLDNVPALLQFLSGAEVILFSVAPSRNSYEAVYGTGLDNCLDYLTRQGRAHGSSSLHRPLFMMVIIRPRRSLSRAR